MSGTANTHSKTKKITALNNLHIYGQVKPYKVEGCSDFYKFHPNMTPIPVPTPLVDTVSTNFYLTPWYFYKGRQQIEV